MERKYLRDMQKRMFECSARCCENKAQSREAVEACVEKCNTGMKGAQRTLERELGELQVSILVLADRVKGQLSRGAMTCYDKLVQSFGPDVNKYTEAQMSSFNEKLDMFVFLSTDTILQMCGKVCG